MNSINVYLVVCYLKRNLLLFRSFKEHFIRITMKRDCSACRCRGENSDRSLNFDLRFGK